MFSSGYHLQETAALNAGSMRAPLMIALAVVALAGIGGVAGLRFSSSPDVEPVAPIVVHTPERSAPATPLPPIEPLDFAGVPHPPPPANLGDVCVSGTSDDRGQ